MKCAICDQRVKRSEAYFGDKGTLYEGKPLCENCYYENEPCATVIYSKDDTPYTISETRNETEGDFRVKWHRTDPWRGYYETKSKKYALVNTELIEELGDNALTELQKRMKIKNS